MATAGHKNRWFLLLVPVGLYIVVLLAFQPLVDWETRRILNVFKGYTSTYEKCWLHPFSFTYHVTGVKIVKETAGGEAEPFFSTDSFEFSVDWRELLHLHLVAKITFEGTAVHLIAAKAKSQQQADPEIPDLGPKLTAVLPLRVQRISLTRSAIYFVDKTQEQLPHVVLDHLEVTMENLATRASLAKGEPTVIAVAAQLQRDAKLSIYLTMDPLAKGLFFSGKFRLERLPLVDLKDVMSSETGLQFDRGTLDIYAEFDCHDGKLSGGIKPLLKNSHVVQGKPGVSNWFKTLAASAAIDIASDRVPERNAVATVIPINGRITKPDIEVWPAVIGVLRNAFVQGVSESYAHLPPPEENGGTNPIKQLVDGLDKNAGPPKAQPTGK